MPQQVCYGKQEDELTGYGYEHADVSIPYSLEEGPQGDAYACTDEAEAYSRQGYLSYRQHLGGGVEPGEQCCGKEYENDESCCHDDEGDNKSYL